MKILYPDESTETALDFQENSQNLKPVLQKRAYFSQSQCFASFIYPAHGINLFLEYQITSLKILLPQ